MSEAPPAYHCYRHADREAYIRCQRCERLICPDCMRDASVGFQCPSCLAEGQKSVRSPRTMAGGLVSTSVGRVSLVLIVINVAAYVLQIATGNRTSPLLIEGGMTTAGVADGQYWRLVTSAFLHFGILHLAFNMYALYIFGPFVERALGTWRFIAAYLLMAVTGSVFVYTLSDPRALTAGASGAVFGLFAIALVLMLKAKQDVTTLLVLLAINALLSFRGGVSWQGHLGGFVAGLLIAAAVALPPKERRQAAQIGVAVLLVIGCVAAIVLRTGQITLV